MVSSPHIIGLTVKDSDGAALSNVQVSCRVESTNESVSKNTGSDGKVVFNLGSSSDFPSGYNAGDVVSFYSLYQGFGNSFSYAVPAVGSEVSVSDDQGVSIGTASFAGLQGSFLVNVTVSSPSLRYFTVQEFLDYFNLKDLNSDSENGVKVQRVVSVGESVEAGIDADTNSKFDSNSGSFYSPGDVEGGESPEYLDVKRDDQRDFFLRFKPVQSLSRFEVTSLSEGSVLDDWKNLVFVRLDSCDATSGWSAGTDGSVSLNSTPSSVNEGDGALNLVKSGATTAAVTYSKTFGSGYHFGSLRKLNVDYYIEDRDDLASSDAVELRFGQDSSNYFSQTWDRSDLSSAGWNTLGFGKDSTNVTVTGSPVVENCDYFAVVVTTVASSTTISAGDQRLDDVRLNEKDRVVFDKVTGRVRITDSDDWGQKGARHARAVYTFGRSSVPADIRELAIIDTGVRILGSAFVRSRILNKSDAEQRSLRWFDDFRMRVILKYKNHSFIAT